eukprot:3655204-Rhodomonas_salina.2
MTEDTHDMRQRRSVSLASRPRSTKLVECQQIPGLANPETPVRPVGVYELIPIPIPCTVTVADPVEGEFEVGVDDSEDESYDTIWEAEPLEDPIVTATRPLCLILTAALQTTEVCAIQWVSSHCVPAILTRCVCAMILMPAPCTVIRAEVRLPVFAGLALDNTGRSYECISVRVPVLARAEKTTRRVLRVPETNCATVEVSEIHAVASKPL